MVLEFAGNPVNDMTASRNSYHRPLGSPKLVKSIVVLMDILGYTDLTQKAEEEGRSQAFLVDLYESLKKMGLEPIDTTGQKFDPNLHQAVDRVETDNEEDHQILEEYQKGYKFKGKLLRPSMVKVAVRPS